MLPLFAVAGGAAVVVTVTADVFVVAVVVATVCNHGTVRPV